MRAFGRLVLVDMLLFVSLVEGVIPSHLWIVSDGIVGNGENIWNAQDVCEAIRWVVRFF